MQYIKASELFPKKAPWVEDGHAGAGVPVPPPFPLLPGEGVIYEGRTVEGSLYISNYRLYLFKTPVSDSGSPASAASAGAQFTKDINVPLGLIDYIECKDIFYLNLYCKDARSFRLVFATGDSCQDWAKRLVQYVSVARKPEDVFSLAFSAWARDTDESHPSDAAGSKSATSPAPASTLAESNLTSTAVALRGVAHATMTLTTRPSSIPWWRRPLSCGAGVDSPLMGEELLRFEVERQGYWNVTWRVSSANAVDFKLCPSYPSHLLVPTSISDDKLEAVAAFRSVRRLPAVVWRNRRNGAVLARCSQPEVGWLGWRSKEDENLLEAILNACFYDSSRNTGRFRETSPSASTSGLRLSESSTASSFSLRGSNGADGWSVNGDGSVGSGAASAAVDCGNGTVDGDSAAENGGAVASSPPAECGSLKDLSEESSLFTQGKKKMLIVDARSYATAVANRARGGGCEFPQYYPQCDIEFMNLANIHAVRKSFILLRSLCQTAANTQPAADQSNWFTQLDNTRWLHHMANLLRASWYTAENLVEHGRPVLVHCSDGWDRTPQIVSLAELLVDPFYRTFRGFQVLVQREWLEFGHKFADRCGLLGGCDDLNERCPVFLQFLDCVHQLMKQFPTAFQFNHAYLVKMVQHVYSNLFGTFMWNTVQERTVQRMAERSHSLWTLLLEKGADYCNHLYDSEASDEPLCPSYQVRDLEFWSAVYLADLGNTGCTTNGCHASDSSAAVASTAATAPNAVGGGSHGVGSHGTGANNHTSSNSPCSSGYATPQQTALTDSMVDALAWKNQQHSLRRCHPMEDSTDTLVDDASVRAVQLLQLDDTTDTGTEDLEADAVESFPLLEPPPSPVRMSQGRPTAHLQLPPVHRPHAVATTAFNDRQNVGNDLTVDAALSGDDEADGAAALTSDTAAGTALDLGSLGDGHFNADCPTCRSNWNLLNGLSSSAVVADTLLKVPVGPNTNSSSAACLNFDLDGLLPCFDRQQVRLKHILALKEMEIEALRRDLQHTRVALCRQVCHTCSSKNRPNTDYQRPEPTVWPETEADGDEPQASGLSSWEAVSEHDIDKGGKHIRKGS